MSTLSELNLDRQLKRTQQDFTTLDSVIESTSAYDVAPAPISSGGAAQDINTSNVTINGDVITPGSLPPSLLDVSNWGWTQSCTFSSASSVQVNWGAGTFTSANGISYAISAGNTGTMSAKNYIYLDLNTSITTYQVTTNPSLAVGIGKVLIAVAQNSTSPVLATFNLSEATQIVGDNILANTIDASKIVAGSITATQISSSYIYAGYIDADKINAGTLTSMTISGGTIAIGSGNNIFKADSNGIYLGNATFASAPFRVSMAGAVAASDMTITGGSVTSAVIKSASTGNRLLILDSNFGDKTISWVDTNDILKAQVGYDFAGNLQILAPVIYLSTLTDGVKVQGNIFPSSQNSYDLGQANPGGNNWRNAYFSGNIYIDGSVDGVDISAHAGNASAHHSSTSNGLNITPANVELSGHLKLLVTSTPPSSAVDGWMFYHDTYDEIWVFKGGAWKALAYVP